MADTTVDDTVRARRGKFCPASERISTGSHWQTMGCAHPETNFADDVIWTTARSLRHAANTCAAIAVRHASGVKPNGPISER